MPHELQTRYAKMVLAKLRQDLVLKDGVVFNNDYEGSPTAGSVKIAFRDEEVAVSDYDKANGIAGSTGATEYITMNISKDKAINEIIDGYDAASVPDGLVAERIDSGTYSLAYQMDSDGGAALKEASSKINCGRITEHTAYSTMVDARTALTKDKVPDDNKRYALVTPEVYGLILKAPEFIKATELGGDLLEKGVQGKIAGFNVIEWNDDTENLGMIVGHLKFATRAKEFSVEPHLQDLAGSGKYIGASAVQGRNVYDHKVLRSVAIKAFYLANNVKVAVAVGSATGSVAITATLGTTGNTLAYKLNPGKPAYYGMTSDLYNGTALTSGTAKTATGCVAGDVVEVLEFDTDGICVSKAAITLTADDVTVTS